MLFKVDGIHCFRRLPHCKQQLSRASGQTANCKPNLHSTRVGELRLPLIGSATQPLLEKICTHDAGGTRVSWLKVYS